MTAVTGTVVASVAVLGMKSVPYIDLHVDQEASVFEASIHPDSAPFIGTNFSVRLQDAQSEMAVPSGKGCDLSSLSDREPPGCTYGTEGRGVSIALVGDSHAAQWAPAFEALAERGEIFLTAHTKSACSLHDRSITREVRELTVCKNWKKAVVQKLNEQKPEVIVLTHSVTSKLVSPEAYFSAMDELLDALPAQSEVVLLRDTPRFTGDPVSCLSRHLEHPLSCSKLRTEVLNETFYEVDLALSERPNVHVLDMTDYICADLCHVAQDNVLVYKDQQHLSKTFTRLLAPAVREELEKVFT